MKPQVTVFLNTAYQYQTGQFYPERHISNLERLAKKFPDYDAELIDCLYRLAIHLDTYASELAEKIADGQMEKPEAFQHLAVIFKQFSQENRGSALENALDRLEEK